MFKDLEVVVDAGQLDQLFALLDPQGLDYIKVTTLIESIFNASAMNAVGNNATMRPSNKGE